MFIRAKLLPIALLAACVGSSSMQSHADLMSRDCAVIAAVLDSLFTITDGSRGARPLVLSDSTSVFLREELAPGYLDAFGRVEGGTGEASADFEVRARTTSTLRPIEACLREASRVPFQLTDSMTQQRLTMLVDTIDRRDSNSVKMSAHAYWQAFGQLYPDHRGHIEFSAVGYDRLGENAILHVMFSCGPSCAEGQIVRLSRVGNRWRVVSRRTIELS
jgi:hypothetical protein